MGLLPLIAADFGVSEDTASTIISAYALGTVVGAPGVAALTAKLPRRRLILILLGLIVVGAGLGFGSSALAGAALSVAAVVLRVVAARLARHSAR